jgi:hypothetical protein
MSLAYIGTSGRGEVTSLLSLFSTHISKPYKQTKMTYAIENYSMFAICILARCLLVEGVRQSGIHCRLTRVYSQNAFSRKGYGTVKASHCLNFSHQKQRSPATDIVKLLKTCVKLLNEGDRGD